MPKSNLILVLLTGYIISFTGCTSTTGNQTTVVFGTIQFSKSDKIYFYSYADSVDLFLDNMTAVDSSLIDKNGHYSISHHFTTPMLFNLVCADSTYVSNLFISPGDKIKINFIGPGRKPEIFPSGQTAINNLNLLRFTYTFYRDPDTKQQYYIASNYMDLPAFTAYTENRKQKQFAFFKDSVNSISTRDDFSNYTFNTIQYGIAIDRLLYLWKKRMKGTPVTPDSSYFQYETPGFIQNKTALTCPAYIHFLNLYIKDTFERMVERNELPVDKSEKLIPAVEKFRLAYELLDRPYLDIVLYNIITNDRKDAAVTIPGVNPARASLDSLVMEFRKKYSIN